MKEMLELVPDDVDKREGSIVYNALAPAATKLVQAYVDIELNRRLGVAETSHGEWLRMRVAEHGVNFNPATPAKRKGLFYGSNNQPIDVPIGSRFSLGTLTYDVKERIATGNFLLECETAGVIGNQQFGTMLPIEYIDGLVRAELSDVLVPGEDEESDEDLYQRYLTAINEQPFGGNIADYKEKVGGINGVGGVKVFPAWQGGGTVKCTILAADFNPPTELLVQEVQSIIDPVTNSGEGLGLAPIGHRVTISPAQFVPITISTNVVLQPEFVIEQVKPDILKTINEYLLSLRKMWKDNSVLVVRVSQIEARVLGVKGITDIMGTILNGTAGNLTLQSEQVPMDGEVTINVG
nr:baseplate J/gp47 family protein [Brevibacillus brevis]